MHFYSDNAKQNEEKVLEIHQKIMMTSQTALQGVLGMLLEPFLVLCNMMT